MLRCANRTLGFVGIAIAMCLLAGCSDPYQRAQVRGRVMYQGKPAAGATVEFHPIDAPEETGRPKGNPGSPSVGVADEDGWFTLAVSGANPGPGVVVGRHQIKFKPPPTARRKLTGDDKAVMTPDEIKEWEEKLNREPIYPPLPKGTTIKPTEVTVKPGNNEFEFTLQVE
jgi:hypothetical protein